MEQISEKEAIRLAETAVSASYPDREMLWVRLKEENVFSERSVEELKKMGLSSDAIADLTSRYFALPFEPHWHVAFLLNSPEFRGGFAMTSISVDSKTGALEINHDLSGRALTLRDNLAEAEADERSATSSPSEIERSAVLRTLAVHGVINALTLVLRT